MGKGLGLKGTQDEPLSGCYAAYAAGTGLLVFIDLVAAIAWNKIVMARHEALRHLLGVGQELYINNDFKFILNLCQRPESAFGIDLLKLVAELCPEHFEMRDAYIGRFDMGEVIK